MNERAFDKAALLSALEDYSQLNALLTRAALEVLRRRLVKKGRCPGWSQQLETIVEMLMLGIPQRADFHVNEIRGPVARLTAIPLPLPVKITPVNAGGVPGEWVQTWRNPPTRVVLYLHGGGYIAGSPRTHRLLTAEIARRAATRLLVIDYRLAPEHPFPAALVDAQQAYRWLLAQGLPAQRIVVAGDSAGGGLAVALLLALREAGLPLPGGAICLSPWFDLAVAGDTIERNAQTDYLNSAVLRGAAHFYLAGVDPHTPLASPLYADLHGLPPMLVQAGSAEVLLDDAQRFVAQAQQAGVDVRLEIGEQMIHVWQFFHLIAPQARQALRSIGQFIQEVTNERQEPPVGLFN
jgi:epsilon-lactone hydrolase